jgi:ribonuclease BN (tRNA processing enzyme)
MMKLTVLGNNGPYPAPGGACSGYLLQCAGRNIVIDLGSGALANLMKALGSAPGSVDAVFLTHLHADHMSDIAVLRYALESAGRGGRQGGARAMGPGGAQNTPPENAPEQTQGGQRENAPDKAENSQRENAPGGAPAEDSGAWPGKAPGKAQGSAPAGGGGMRKISLFCPDKPDAEYAALRSYAAFDVAPISEGLDPRVPGLDFRFAAMRHPYPCFAISAEASGAAAPAKLVFSGDSAWNEGIVELAKGADLLLLDACLSNAESAALAAAGKPPLHFTAEECGAIAALAGAKRLLLTHFPPGSDIALRVEEAKAGMRKITGRGDSVPVEAAGILRTYEV